MHLFAFTYKRVCHELAYIIKNMMRNMAYLVTVTPLEVLGANVLVGVLGALLQRRHVAPVLPMLRPQPVGVGTRKSHARNNTASFLLALCHHVCHMPAKFSRFGRFRVIRSSSKVANILDRDLPPQLCNQLATHRILLMSSEAMTDQWCRRRAP